MEGDSDGAEVIRAMTGALEGYLVGGSVGAGTVVPRTEAWEGVLLGDWLGARVVVPVTDVLLHSVQYVVNTNINIFFYKTNFCSTSENVSRADLTMKSKTVGHCHHTVCFNSTASMKTLGLLRY